MGVDCKISLPQEASVNNVAKVIGILLGKRVTLNERIGQPQSYVSADIDGISTVGIDNLPDCCHIKISGTERGDRQFLYHFEWTNGTSKDQEHNIRHGRGLILRSYAPNIALGIGLVKFFGGSVDFNDCDNEYEDFKRAKRRDIAACNGIAWENFQRRIAKLKPLTWFDIMDCEQHASYKMGDEDNLEYKARKTLYQEMNRKKLKENTYIRLHNKGV